METKKCTRCKNVHNIEEYQSDAGRKLKMCKRCRILRGEWNEKNKCVHNLRKGLCKKCGGGSLCIHDRSKYQCINCCGSSMCIHNKEKDQCKLCSDPIKITIMNMIKSSKHTDIKKNKYDANHFIDYPFVEQLVFESKNCHYCKIEMQFIEYQDDMCTIERLDNSIGHIKSNCVLACRECNFRKVGQK